MEDFVNEVSAVICFMGIFLASIGSTASLPPGREQIEQTLWFPMIGAYQKNLSELAARSRSAVRELRSDLCETKNSVECNRSVCFNPAMGMETNEKKIACTKCGSALTVPLANQRHRNSCNCEFNIEKNPIAAAAAQALRQKVGWPTR